MEEVLLCGCKRTATPPFCDGAHNNLPGGYLGDDRSDEERARLKRVEPDADGLRRLDNGCYVVAPHENRPPGATGFWMRTIIAPSLGARHQSQFYLETPYASSPALSAGDSDAIIFIARGSGEIEISGRRFRISSNDGAYVRGGEAFRLHAESEMAAFVSALPGIERLDRLDATPANFDHRFAERVRGVDAAQRSAMGPRYFQMLVDQSVGSAGSAQFIGHIPPSRARMHRHLYEEALIILTGEGVLWNEETCARVSAGDVIFLPRKQAHSLECVDPAGMDVAGVIHPGDNPGINY